MMVLCVAGKNNIAVDVAEYLYRLRLEESQLCVVCNQGDSGTDTWQKSLRGWAREHSVRDVELESLYELDDLIFLSLQFDRIIKPDKFRSKRLYNIHFSLLPKYKGCHTAVLPILQGEKYVGVTLHMIDHGIDTGDIIAQKKFLLKDKYTSEDLYLEYIHYGTQLAIQNIDNILEGNVVSYPQESRNSTYYPKEYIDYKNPCIRLKDTAEGVLRQIRAFSFPQYQLPVVNGNIISRGEITGNRSTMKAGTIIQETFSEILLATVDYDVILYKNKQKE